MIDNKYDVNLLEEQYVGHCNSCAAVFHYTANDTWFDENGYSYSTKLTKCPECDRIVILKYIEDNIFNIN